LRDLESGLLWPATRLALAHGLTSADSYHLATALDCLNFVGHSDKFVFICSDVALCRAAVKERVFVLNPIADDAEKLLDLLA
jgi:hypothetical protein